MSHPNVVTSPIHDALIGLQMAILAVDAFDDVECFEWQSIRDAWEQVRARLAVADKVALNAVVHPSEQRRLSAFLEELSELYHLETGQPIVDRPRDRIEQKIKKAIWTFAPADPQTPVVDALAELSDEQAKPATVNERMSGTIMKNAEAVGWNCTKWARKLKCARSTVTDTPTWKNLKSVRMKDKAERIKDRRRKPKASDQRRD